MKERVRILHDRFHLIFSKDVVLRVPRSCQSCNVERRIREEQLDIAQYWRLDTQEVLNLDECSVKFTFEMCSATYVVREQSMSYIDKLNYSY